MGTRNHQHKAIDGDYLLETLQKSIEINSILPHEADYATFLADEIGKLGLEPEWEEVAPGRPNVYAMAQLGPHDDLLLLTGHSDTVGIAAHWETNPFEPVLKNGRLYGLGAFDMKSGVVCALAAFKALVEDQTLHGKLGRVAFAVTVDEESSNEMVHALRDAYSLPVGMPFIFCGWDISGAEITLNLVHLVSIREDPDRVWST